MTDRLSIWPLLNCSTLGMTLNAATNSTTDREATVSTASVTGGKPHSTMNKQMTTERMKLMTWFRVNADVMLVIDRYAPARKKLPM